LIELRNAVQTALLVVHAAALNPVSQGCHTVVPDNGVGSDGSCRLDADRASA
jgi:hypothetical protein